MSKTVLIVLGILILLMGIWGLFPSLAIAGDKDPVWHAILKIIVGVIATWVGVADKA